MRRFHYLAVALPLLVVALLLTDIGLLVSRIILIFKILFPGGG